MNLRLRPLAAVDHSSLSPVPLLMSRSRLLALSFLLFVTACEGFKEAMTAHVDVAAKAGSQELSVQRLAEMMGKSQVPLRKEVAQGEQVIKTVGDKLEMYKLEPPVSSRVDLWEAAEVPQIKNTARPALGRIPHSSGGEFCTLTPAHKLRSAEKDS